MNQYKADLHIHTLLSPCGDLEMSPAAIVQRAADLSIDILGITDHNSTRHAPLIAKLAKEQGIFTLCGAEVTTREEAHCLAFFSDFEKLDDFQKYLDDHLPNIKNDTNIFGYQVVIDEQEMIVDEIEKLLISAIDQSIDQITKKVRELGGMFIPAHIDRPKFSLTSQLGFVPPGMDADALEVSVHSSSQKICNDFPYLKKYSFVRGSDAHYINHIGSSCTLFEMEELSFDEIRSSLLKKDGRNVKIAE